MTVQITSPVEGLQPGDTYTGDREAYLLASGYAVRTPAVDAVNGQYTGPGVANTGPADIGPASNPEFDATRPVIATGSDLPEGGTNDGVTTAAPPAPTTDAV
jgi:hypothetical protein